MLWFLIERWILDITILDKNPINCEFEEIRSVTWDWYLDNLERFDYICKSPGISPFQEKLLPYREKFISWTQIFFENYVGKTIWITGTKGKSTISTLLYECLSAWGYKVKLVGNIWAPVLSEINLEKDTDYDYVIYELSSYMLQDFSPKLEIWFLNNIFPCHLDWHYDSFSIYKQAKINILQNAHTKILHGDLSSDSDIAWIREIKTFFDSKWAYSSDEHWFYINSELVYSNKILLEWEHNKKNICWVIAMLHSITKDVASIAQMLEKVLPIFSWLPNRIEYIGTYEGIRFINDAIATTPESTLAAIDTFSWEVETLFLWWEDSGFSFSCLRESILKSGIKNIIAFPDTSEKVFPEIELRDYEHAFEIDIEGKSLQFIKTRSMKIGVDFAYKTTLPWKLALLSCAAPSFSIWNNYLEKAQEFKKYVKEY